MLAPTTEGRLAGEARLSTTDLLAHAFQCALRVLSGAGTLRYRDCSIPAFHPNAAKLEKFQQIYLVALGLTPDNPMGDKKINGPLYNIPEHLVKRYTMCGRVPIINQFYWGELGAGEIKWTKQQYRALLEAAKDCYENEVGKSYESDVYLVRLLKRYSLAGKTVLIIGSESPFYEAMVTYLRGAPTTVEYRKIDHDIQGLSTYTVEELETSDLQFDCALSVSSIEHSGLGRYGDPLDPDGDLKAMEMYRRHIKAGGQLFLQVPVGPDALVWNAHRVYGPMRLDALFSGWQLIEGEGFDPSMFRKAPLGWFDQPAFVLCKPL